MANTFELLAFQLAKVHMNQEADPNTVAEFVEQHSSYHQWDDVKVAEVIADRMNYFSRDFVSRVFQACDISRHRADGALGNLLNAGVVELDGNTGTRLPSYRMPRATKEEINGKLSTNDEPELTDVSKALESVIAELPEGPFRDFGSEALRCMRVKAYRSAVVMAWNLAIDYLVIWITEDKTRLELFNAEWTKEWKDRSAKIHNTKLVTPEDLRTLLKESVVIRIAGKAKLVDKPNTNLLEDALRKRNQAAHPSNAITFAAPTAAGHVHALVSFVIGHPL